MAEVSSLGMAPTYTLLIYQKIHIYIYIHIHIYVLILQTPSIHASCRRGSFHEMICLQGLSNALHLTHTCH